MYIRLTKSGSSKSSTKVYLVEGYKDVNGKVKQRIVKSYGNLEDLEKEDPNILEKLKQEAKQLPKNTVTLHLNMNEENSKEEDLLRLWTFLFGKYLQCFKDTKIFTEKYSKN